MTLRRIWIGGGLLALSCATVGPRPTSLQEDLPPWQTPPTPPAPPPLQDRIVQGQVSSSRVETGESESPGIALRGDETIISFRDPRGRSMFLRLLPQSRSVGSPNRGRLIGGRELPKEGPGWIRISPNAWGTDETVATLQWALEDWSRTFPDAPPVVVGALSKEGGGRLRPHKSHQSGRDVDIGLVPTDRETRKGFVPYPKSRIDFHKTVHLMALLVSTGRVQSIFIHRSLIPDLRRASEEAGISPDLLARMFGTPTQKGVIQPWKGHRAHYHVRFACPVGDPTCHAEAVRLAPKSQAVAGKRSGPERVKKAEKAGPRPARKVLTNTRPGGKPAPGRTPGTKSREQQRRY